MIRRNARGFTLVEILVALAIIAVALGAGLRALSQSIDSAGALKQRTLALWVAQNRIAATTLETPWPAPGRRNGVATNHCRRGQYRTAMRYAGCPHAICCRAQCSTPAAAENRVAF